MLHICPIDARPTRYSEIEIIMKIHSKFQLRTEQMQNELIRSSAYRSFVLSSLPSIQLFSFPRSLALNPTLNFFGSVVKLVGSELHSNASKIGKSFGSRGGSI
jgi:hypothetical protein